MGGGVECPPDAFHQEIFADLPGKEKVRQGKKKRNGQKRQEIVKGKMKN